MHAVEMKIMPSRALLLIQMSARLDPILPLQLKFLKLAWLSRQELGTAFEQSTANCLIIQKRHASMQKEMH